MKRILLLVSLFVSTLCSFGLETKKVAILEVVDKKEELSYYQKLMLRARLAEEVNNAAGFEAYDRSNVDAIMSEHNFQRTGLVDDAQIKKLSEMTGAAYILVIEGALSSKGHLFVLAVILDIETGKMVVTESENMLSSEDGMQQGCASLAKKLFSKLKTASVTYLEEQQRLLQEEKAAKEANRAQYYVKGGKTNTYIWSLR